MDEDRFNMSLRKFLKQVGVTSQQEIERVVREAHLTSGKLKVRAVLTAEGTDLNHIVEGVRQIRGTSTSQVDGAEVSLVTSAPPPGTSALLLVAA